MYHSHTCLSPSGQAPALTQVPWMELTQRDNPRGSRTERMWIKLQSQGFCAIDTFTVVCFSVIAKSLCSISSTPLILETYSVTF